MTDFDWLVQFLNKVSTDPRYVSRLRADPSAVREVSGVPQEVEDNLQNGNSVILPSGDDPCAVIKQWLEKMFALGGISRWHFMLE
jgi:hypothetical protein